MKFLKQLVALCALVYRSIADPIGRYVNYWRLKYRWWGKVRFNLSVTISPETTFEGANSIGNRTYLNGRMGYGSYCMQDCFIEGNIGRFCSIAAEVKVVRGTHPIGLPYATTSPMFFSTRKQTGVTFVTEERFSELKEPIRVGNDCWIGPRSLVVGGVTIADGAVVLAGAVVTKDVPPYAVVGGVPARVVRYRYDQATIDFLLQTRWWEQPTEWLKVHAEWLCDVETLKKELQ